MANFTTAQWSGSTTPQITLWISQASETPTTVTFNWQVTYVAHGYAAYTNGVGRPWHAYIDGSIVAKGNFNINGVTGQVMLQKGSTTVGKTTSKRNVSCSVDMSFDLTWSGVYGNTKSASGYMSIPAKTVYTITYNANGGTSAPGTQSYYAGVNTTLSTVKPVRTGHTFLGWSLSSSASSASYQPGQSWSGTNYSNYTLYAVWKVDTYTIKYDANGGSGAPSNQTKTYGVNLTLSSTKPTRTNYNFLGWGTSSISTTVAYESGAQYSSNSSITLYAIWELAYSDPGITNFTADRCNASGDLIENGQYAKVSFYWRIDEVNSGGLTNIVIQWKRATESSWSSTTAVSGGSAMSGNVSKVIGSNTLDTDYDYDIQVVVTDKKGNATYSIVLPAMKYIIDFLAGGDGIRIGGPAHKKGFRDQFNTVFSNGCANLNFETDDILDPNTTLENLIMTNINTPNSGYMYIHTIFNEEKNTDANRAQFALPYNSSGSMYHRYFYNGTWSEWRRHRNEDDTISTIYTATTLTTNVPSVSTATVSRLTLPIGKYVISANIEFTSGFSDAIVLNVQNSTLSQSLGVARGAGTGGGGLTVSGIHEATAETTFNLLVYQGSSSAKTVRSRFKAIKIE